MTFRFYLVSIVAFFLALAVGVVLGSVLDGGISDSLKDRLVRVEANLNETVTAIDEKNVQIEQLQQYVDESAPFAVEDQLSDTTAVVAVEPGVELGPVQDLVLRLRQSGASVAGILSLDPRWTLKEKADFEQLQQIADTSGTSVAELQREVWSLIFESTEFIPATSTTTVPETVPESVPETVPETEPADPLSNAVLKKLQDAGFVKLLTVDGTDGLGGQRIALFVVTGTNSTLAKPGSLAGQLANAAAAAKIPTVLAEVFVPAAAEQKKPAERGDTFRFYSGNEAAISTVNDLDLVAGRVAAVLSVSDLQQGRSGNFGYGPQADSVLPPWLEP
ncbi:MAG: copper transporter [Microthrixaceae bacterium]